MFRLYLEGRGGVIAEVILARLKGVDVVVYAGIFHDFERWGGCMRGLFRHAWDSNATR